MFDRLSGQAHLFLSDDPAAKKRLGEVSSCIVEALAQWACSPEPCTSMRPDALAEAIGRLDPCPEDGLGLDEALDQIGSAVLANGVRPSDPRCAAHLHCPTLLTAAATELAIGVTNQSMDSFDQAPAATLVEDHLVRWLARQLGLPTEASGVLTAGGTASNLLGLFLAREHYARTRGSAPAVARDGLPAEAHRWRIVCSQAAHFSVQRAAGVLGLGHRAVVPVATDHYDRIDLDALDQTLDELAPEARVVAIVGTAGTTDAGAIDPLAALAERARDIGAWFHVDAAVGGAFCLSDSLGGLLRGIEEADSVVVDFHKLWWQPIGASALLVRDELSLGAARHQSDYLDRPDDDGEDVLNLVGRSLDTSRRFDALKILVSLRSTGRRQMATMVEHVVATTAATAKAIEAHPHLELLSPVSTVTVLFRWHPPGLDLPGDALDRANIAIQRELFASGRAVIGRTRSRGGQVALKLTVVNPLATVDDLAGVAQMVADEGARLVPSSFGSPTEAGAERPGPAGEPVPARPAHAQTEHAKTETEMVALP